MVSGESAIKGAIFFLWSSEDGEASGSRFRRMFSLLFPCFFPHAIT